MRCRPRRETRLPEATGVVLAGGRSTRFGTDKLAQTYRGMPLVHHAILRLGEVCSEVVLVLPPGGLERPPPIGVEVRVAQIHHMPFAIQIYYIVHQVYATTPLGTSSQTVSTCAV